MMNANSGKAPAEIKAETLYDIVSAIDREFHSSNAVSIKKDSPTGETETGAQLKHIVFQLAGNRFAVPIQHMFEVGWLRYLTPIPGVPGWLLGVTNLRGDIISVIDCRRLFDFEPLPQPESGRLVVVHTEKRDLTTALIVDRIEGMVWIPETGIHHSAVASGDVIAGWLRGSYQQGNKLINVLNLENLLRSLDHSW